MADDRKIQIIVKENAYYMTCDLSNEPVYLCKKNELNDIYVNTQAEWVYDRIRRKKDYNLWKKKCASHETEEMSIPELPSGFSLNLKNKKYYIKSEKYGEDFLCPDTEECRYYLTEIAYTYINNRLREERMDSWEQMIQKDIS